MIFDENCLDKVNEIEQIKCNHGISFDEEKSKVMTSDEVRKNYPRLSGICPKGCGYKGIYYTSYSHYIAGDW